MSDEAPKVGVLAASPSELPIMCVGIAPTQGLMTSASHIAHEGSSLVLFGASTGRDGIGGASVLASATLEDGSEGSRPSVQIGDPFAGKLLIEASLEMIEAGLLEGLQDLGAAGISCAVSESASRARMSTRQELVASDLTIDEINAFLGADSLGYLSLDGLIRAAGSPKDDFCRACFDGEYPVAIPERAGKFVLEEQLQLPTP